MTDNKISFALSPVLTKKTKVFTGGRITDIDLLTLDEAAKMATKHAGCEVTTQDFLRAASRGEIELIAIVKKDTKFKYLDKPELEPWIIKGGIWRIPLNACKALASTGFAQWRIQEDVKVHCGNYMKYLPTIQITDDEPDLEAIPSDCRVLGHHIHALADAFIPQTAAESKFSSEPAPTVADSASSVPGNKKVWTHERLAELKAYREAHTMSETATKFGISQQRIRQLLPRGKPKSKGYGVFTHHTL